jgi:hypothetical protein
MVVSVDVIGSDTADTILVEVGVVDIPGVVVVDNAGVTDALPAELSSHPSDNEAASAARL